MNTPNYLGRWFAVFQLLFVQSALGQQSASLTLSSASVPRGGSVPLNLSLTSAATAPAGLQWTLSYSPNDITAISVTSGDASSAAGKSVSCAGSPGSYLCIATGVNSNTIGNGVVAVLNVTTSLTAAASTSITLTGTLGATLSGDAIAVSGTGGTLTITSSADTAPPSVPGGLTATAASSSRINLDWSASTDNIGVTGYRVYRNGSQVGTATGTSYAARGPIARGHRPRDLHSPSFTGRRDQRRCAARHRAPLEHHSLLRARGWLRPFRY